jgi:hypothetical protein
VFMGMGLATILEPEQREIRPRSGRILSREQGNYRPEQGLFAISPESRDWPIGAMSATHGPGALNKYTNGRSDRVL